MNKQELQLLIGSNLQKARTEQHLTREQLAEQVGISPTFYANLESGNKMMSLVTLRKLVDTLHISADYLLFGDGETGKINNLNLILRDIPAEKLTLTEKLLRVIAED